MSAKIFLYCSLSNKGKRNELNKNKTLYVTIFHTQQQTRLDGVCTYVRVTYHIVW